MADLLLPAILVGMLAILLAGATSAAFIAGTDVSFPDSLAFLHAAWDSFCAWLVPPYLFAAIHLIIVLIWKLSDKKHPCDPHPNSSPSPTAAVEAPPKPRDPPEIGSDPSSDDGSCIRDESEEKLDENEAPAMENETMEEAWRTIVEAGVGPKGKTISGAPSTTGHEELDRRFEDFIRMNYAQMRLQRDEANEREWALVGSMMESHA